MVNTKKIVDEKINTLNKTTELQKKILMLIQTSRMPLEEKKMWIAMLPYMEMKHLEKLLDIVQREANEIAGMYIKALNESVA